MWKKTFIFRCFLMTQHSVPCLFTFSNAKHLFCLLFSKCRSFALVTITHSHQTVPTSSSSSSSPLSLKFSCLQNPFPPTYMPIFCMSHYNYMHESNYLFALSQCWRTNVPLLFPFGVPFQMQHNFFLWINAFIRP